VVLFGDIGDPLQKRILTHAPHTFFPTGLKSQRLPATTRDVVCKWLNVGSVAMMGFIAGGLDYN
jgi:hypothetical protein